MDISDYIKSSLDEADRGNLEQSLMHVCAAIDGTSKRLYKDDRVGVRFKRFITEHVDLIQHMFGGVDLEHTIFPFSDSKGKIGVKFDQIIYNEYRNRLMHGEAMPDGWQVNASIVMHHDLFDINLAKKTMSLPQSAIYALGFPCVLSHINAEQCIGEKHYFYKDLYYTYFIDRWWGKINIARSIIYYERDIKVKLDFSNHMDSNSQKQ